MFYSHASEKHLLSDLAHIAVDIHHAPLPASFRKSN